MYCSHFGLHRPPFNNTPDPSFYYSTPDHEEAMATLQYATCHRKGFVLITGEVGAGKTLVGRMFIRQLDREASTAVITHTQLNAGQLLAAICAEFELPVTSDATHLQLADTLQEFLLEEFARDRFVVVLIDEGQNLPDESFEALRMLGNLEADDAKLLQVCILGQPELRDRFKKRNMRQLDQRLFRRFHLPALNEHQAAEYIRRRLSIAGAARDDIFTEAAIRNIFMAAHGIPRVINQLCDNAMLAAYGQGANSVDEAVVDLVLDHDRSADTEAASTELETAEIAQSTSRPAKAATAKHAAVAANDEVIDIETTTAVAVAEAPSTPVPLLDMGVTTSPPSDEETQARIERIYGSRPVMTSTVAVMPPSNRRETTDGTHTGGNRDTDDATSARRQYLKEILAGVSQDWDLARDEFETYRKDIQSALDDVTDRCRLAERQIEDLTQHTIAADEVREIRNLQMTETDRLLGEVTRIRSEFQHLFEQAEQRWNQTRDGLNTLIAEAVTDTVVADLESDHKRRIEETLGRLEQYREHTNSLVGVLRAQCDHTQNSLAALAEAHAQTRTELSDRLRTRLAEAQQKIDEQLRATASAEDLQKLRATQIRMHTALKEQVASHVTEARQNLEERIQQTAEALKSLRETQEQARTALQNDLESRVEQTRGTLDTRITQANHDLNALREAQEQIQDSLKDEVLSRIERASGELQDRLLNTDAAVAVLQASQQHLQVGLREELHARVHHLCDSLQGQIEVAAKTDDVVQLTDEVAAVRDAHRMAIVDLTLEEHAHHHDHEVAIDELKDRVGEVRTESRTAIDDLSGRVENARQEQRSAIIEVAGQVAEVREEHQTAFSRLTGNMGEVAEKVAEIREEHQTAFSKLTGNMGEVAGKVAEVREEHQNAFSKLTGSIGQVAGQVTEVREEHQTALSKLTGSIGEVAGQVTEVREEHQTALSKLTGSIGQVAGQVTEVREEHQTAFSKLTGNIGEIAGKVAEVREEHQTAFSRLTGDIGEVAGQVTEVREEHQTAFSKLTGDIGEVAGQVTEVREEHQTAFSKLTGEIGEVRAESRDAVGSLADDVVQVRTEARTAVGGLINQIGEVQSESREAVGRLVDHIGEVRAESLQAVEQLTARIGGNEQQIRTLAQDVAVQFNATSAAVKALREKAATAAELEVVRNDHRSAIADILQRFDEKSRDLEAFKAVLAQRETQVTDEQRALVLELTGRIDEQAKQLRGVRQRFLRHHLSIQEQLTALREESASRTELEQVREAHAAQAADIVSQIEKNREAVQELIDALAHRCQMTQERLTSLGSAAVDDKHQLAQLRQAQADDVGSLLRQLEEQRLQIAKQFEDGVSHWNQIRVEIQSLRETAAEAGALEELRRRQAKYADAMLGSLADHRRHLEGLVQAVDQRCDELLVRLDALPPEIATPEDIRVLHEENQIHKAALDTAVRRVGEQCDRMQTSLAALENRTASAEDVRQIREQQSKHLDEIIQRIETQSREYQQEVEELNRRWESLRSQVDNLATTTITADKFAAAEESISRDLSSLKAQVGTVKNQREKDVRVLVEVVQRLSERVKQLEALDRPKPVMLEMQPAAARALAELTATADHRAAAMRDLLDNSGAVSDRLTETSSHVQGVMQNWMEQADQVREQSDQLRNSANTAAEILRAMRKCQETINDKLKSERWQTELGRAESLTARLETATHEAQTLYQQLRALLTDCRDDSETWAAKRDEAGRLTGDLSQLIQESKAARGRFVQLMAAIATNTSGIAKAIDSARQVDESERPTPQTARGSGNGKRTESPISRIVWQEMRTHPAPTKVG